MEDAVVMIAKSAGLVLRYYPMVIKQMLARNGTGELVIETNGTAIETVLHPEEKSKKEKDLVQVDS